MIVKTEEVAIATSLNDSVVCDWISRWRSIDVLWLTI